MSKNSSSKLAPGCAVVRLPKNTNTGPAVLETRSPLAPDEAPEPKQHKKVMEFCMGEGKLSLRFRATPEVLECMEAFFGALDTKRFRDEVLQPLNMVAQNLRYEDLGQPRAKRQKGQRFAAMNVSKEQMWEMIRAHKASRNPNLVQRISPAGMVSPIADELFKLAMFLSNPGDDVRIDRLLPVIKLAIDAIHSRAAAVDRELTIREKQEKDAAQGLLT